MVYLLISKLREHTKHLNSLFRQQGQSFGDGFVPSSSEGEKDVQLPPLRAYNYYQSNTVRLRKLQKVASCHRYQ